MLAKTNRLVKKKDFDWAFKGGKKLKEDFLIFRFASGKTENTRLGIVVSQKVSKKATVRNKIKRRIRAVVKPLIPEIKKNTDMVLLVLPGLETKDFLEIEKIIKNLFRKAKLINNV